MAVKTAAANVAEKKTLLRQAKAVTRYREQQFERLDGLWASNSVDKEVDEAGEKNTEVARAAEASAEPPGIRRPRPRKHARENVKVWERP